MDKVEQPKAPLKELYNYFKNINNTSYDETENHIDDNQEAPEFVQINEEINQPIIESEIIAATKSLKNNKSAGADNIVNEHLKNTLDIMLPIYKQLFNLILDRGIVPTNWTLGTILPIYKNKGDKLLPENYRPITLVSCLGKLFTALINARLNKYAEKHETISSCQAGFRKGFSTADNLFIINNLIDLIRSKKKKLYCTFVDFKQAFDMVWRQGLWSKMIDYQVNGKCLTLIKNMYSNIKSKISTSDGTTAYFPCTTGVRQGENLSPFLFTLYLNDLEAYLNNKRVPGIICETNDENIYVFLKIFIMLYADDTVIVSENKNDMQDALNAFEEYCKKWKLTVNVTKTKVLIFSKGRHSKFDKFFFNGTQLEIVNEYKYLGIIFTKSGSYFKTKKTYS